MLYVKGLFQLGKLLEIEQAQVAVHLQVSEPTVSLWATGKRPVPERHQNALLDFFFNAIGRKLAEAKAHGAYVIGVIITEGLRAWLLENYEACGALYEKAKRAAYMVASYAEKDFEQLSEEDWDALGGACVVILRQRDYWRRVKPPVAVERMVEELTALANAAHDA